MGQMQSLISKFFQSEPEHPIKPVHAQLNNALIEYQPLLELQDRRQLVRVEVLNRIHTQHYQSMVMRLDFMRKLIYLDALTPLNPFNPVVVGDMLVLSHHHLGKILVVQGELVDIITEDGEMYYLMSLPNDIGYKQRRFYPRLDVDQNSIVKMRLWSPLRIPWYTRVANISAGGARLSIGGNVSGQLKNNLVLPNCDIQINSGQNINCKAIVKGFRYQRRPYEHTEVSIEFLELGYQQKNWLLQWVDFNSRRHPVGVARC